MYDKHMEMNNDNDTKKINLRILRDKQILKLANMISTDILSRIRRNNNIPLMANEVYLDGFDLMKAVNQVKENTDYNMSIYFSNANNAYHWEIV